MPWEVVYRSGEKKMYVTYSLIKDKENITTCKGTYISSIENIVFTEGLQCLL